MEKFNFFSLIGMRDECMHMKKGLKVFGSELPEDNQGFRGAIFA